MARIYPGLDNDVDRTPVRPEYDGPTHKLYPNALGENANFKFAATTLREKKWQEMMNQITDKPDWERKVHDHNIQSKWRAEVLEYGQQSSEGFSEAMADAMILELKQKTDDYLKNGWIVAFDPGVLKSDVAVSNNLKAALQAAVRPLEDVPETAKDWHPGSHNQVFNLVHPSLWPLMYGITKMRKTPIKADEDPVANIGSGLVLPLDTEVSIRWSYSKHFQWLPANLRFDDQKKPRFTSYINNLHPQRYKALYQIIEEVVDAAIPLWGRTLNSWPIKQRIKYEKIEYHEMPEIPRNEGESDDEYEDRAYYATRDMKGDYIIQPEPHGEEIHYDAHDLKEKFPSGLQVIVKLANIELKPGESYAGGSWHVEGQSNEGIVATALYYYDCENITESRLAFRQACDEEEFHESEWHEDFFYEQGEDQFLGAIYGCENWASSIQDIGSVLCKEGRLLTFPNTVQHRVQPFELIDKTKPGHRKILALFLVDPHLEIISTADVPPQQKHWWVERLLETRGIGFIEKFPPEIINHIFSFVDNPMSLETAKEKRLELIAERSRYVAAQDDHFNEGQYNLCEH